jgi:hypothetical protein
MVSVVRPLLTRPAGVEVAMGKDFEIRVAGEVPEQVLADLQDAHFVPCGVETVLHGPVADQAALIGIINRLQMLGVELREVRQIADAGHPADARATGLG